MKYTGNWRTMYSNDFGMTIHILEYKSEHKTSIPWCDCDRCGQPIKNHMFVIQCGEEGPELDVELAYYGADCIKRLK